MSTTTRVLRCGDRTLELGRRTYVMGVVNITPDSFSDGGRFLEPSEAVDQVLRLLDAGADIVDLGAESTRPGSTLIAVEEELRRLLPVLERLRTLGVSNISVDTSKSAVARQALDLGAAWINDVTALADPEMAAIARRAEAVVLMHQRSMSSGQLGDDVTYRDVGAEIEAYLAERVEAAVAHGIVRDRIIVDPGIGFGKSVADNMALLADAGRFGHLAPVLVGASRKRFLRVVASAESIDELDAATVGACCLAAMGGVDIVRVHEVRTVRRALAVVDAHRR